MTSLQYYCIQGLTEKKNFASQRQNYAQKMQDVQVTKSLSGHSNIDKTKVLKANGSLMQV